MDRPEDDPFSALRATLVGTDRWRLDAPLRYVRWRARPAERYVVPVGFVTDLDSVPRVPFAYAWLKGRAVRAAVVHDHLYRTGHPRRAADRVFLDAMRDEGLPARHRWPTYLAVRLAGWAAHRRKRPDR